MFTAGELHIQSASIEPEGPAAALPRPRPDSQPPRKGEVRPQAGEGAPGFPSAFPSPPLPSPSPSNPKSQIQNPQSEAPDAPSHGRRQVPTTFSPIINDEANILAAIARGDRTIPDLAEEHATTVTALCLWLQREDIQKKLADLTTAGATLTRIAAVNQLPKAVSALSFQIDGYIADRCRNLIKPGLDADRISATRDANVRKAAHLLLRLAKFDPNQPVYRRRERADRAILSEARSPGPDGGAVEQAPRSETEGAPLLPSDSRKGVGGEEASAQHEPVRGALNTPAPSASSSPALLPAPLPDILDLCFSTLAAIAPESSRTSESQTRIPIPVLTSHIPLPTSHFQFLTSPFPPRSRPPPPD